MFCAEKYNSLWNEVIEVKMTGRGYAVVLG